MSEQSEGDLPIQETFIEPTTEDVPKHGYRKVGEKAREFFGRMRFPRKQYRTLGTEVVRKPNIPLYEPQPDNLPDINVSAEELKSIATEDPKRLAEMLTKMRISRTDLSGGFYSLYVPVLASDPSYALAIKIVEPESSANFSSKTSVFREKTDDRELQAELDADNVVFVGKDSPKVEELNPTEKSLILLALEHAKHEEFYGKYVVPADFIVYPAAHDVIGNQFDMEDANDQFLVNHFTELGRITTDNRYVHLKKGEPVYAMVQEYKEMGPSVFKMDPATFTQEQRLQLQEFADTVQAVYDQYGYFPDDFMDHVGSDNLRFGKDGRLLLIDTNGMHHAVTGKSPEHYLQKLRKMAQPST